VIACLPSQSETVCQPQSTHSAPQCPCVTWPREGSGFATVASVSISSVMLLYEIAQSQVPKGSEVAALRCLGAGMASGDSPLARSILHPHTPIMLPKHHHLLRGSYHWLHGRVPSALWRCPRVHMPTSQPASHPAWRAPSCPEALTLSPARATPMYRSPCMLPPTRQPLSPHLRGRLSRTS
jgi:hypothetical protein